jgi:hypothetical protein
MNYTTIAFSYEEESNDEGFRVLIMGQGVTLGDAMFTLI